MRQFAVWLRDHIWQSKINGAKLYRISSRTIPSIPGSGLTPTLPSLHQIPNPAAVATLQTGRESNDRLGPKIRLPLRTHSAISSQIGYKDVTG